MLVATSPNRDDLPAELEPLLRLEESEEVRGGLRDWLDIADAEPLLLASLSGWLNHPG